MELYLYGAGKRGRIIVENSKKSRVNVIGVVDSEKYLQLEKLGDHMVEPPEVLRDKKNINICVTFYSTMIRDTIWDELSEKYQINKENIYSFNDIMKIIYEDIYFSLDFVNEINKSLFVGDWNMKLGGVESWLRDVMCEFAKREKTDIYLVTDSKNSDYPVELSDKVLDFSYESTPEYTYKYVKKGIDFVVQSIPCTMVFSRVDELLLAASLVKKKYPNALRIIMLDHGACDGMTRDIVSYIDEIDCYVVVSSGIKILLEDCGVSSDKIKVMTCPISYDYTCKRSSSSVLRIGYAGRLEFFEKRMDILIKLLEELERNGINYEFNIAGTGTYANIIKDYVEQNNLYEKVKLFGQLDRKQMGQFWSEQDIAVNVSDNEGRPISNMEAMLYGAVPVVTNTIGAVEDVVNGINGYIVSLEDYKEMATKIIYLNKHRDVLQDMSEKAKQMIQEKVNMDVHMQLWEDILNI